jgi:hypothetical protein
MSSVTRFIKQVPLSTTYYSVPASMLSAGTGVYEFVPTATNTVGNYAPGFMQAASTALVNALATAGPYTSCVLRDMGKTVQAPITSLTGNVGFFRQVQLLKPAASGTSFGVLGAVNTPDAYTDYFTFYIPVPVAGLSAVATMSLAFPAAGGQM